MTVDDLRALTDAELMAVTRRTTEPTTLAPAVLLELEVEVLPEREAEFLAFLALAFPFYESQGGRMHLFRDERRPGVLVELGQYATDEEWAQVDRLTSEDARTGEVLRRWRALLAGPPKMRVLRRMPLTV